MVKQGARSARGSVWLEAKAPRSARSANQPSGLDRARITDASVRLLDAEGLAKFSMRRLAGELNVTAMSLYWYVDTKDDLLELALDAATGELQLPDPAREEADWREQLRGLAAQYRALLVRHPWLAPLAGQYLNIGPNALAFSRSVHRVIRRTGLPAYRMTSAIAAVFQFVYGYGTIEARFRSRITDSGLTPDAYYQQAMNSARQDPEAADYLQESKDIMDARGGDTVEEMMDRDFTYALDLLVAGIEAMVERG
ncbi:TetR/AcrR family transcriptional regulator [Streptomyces sp. FXJ1.172]|jgi:AcrR family transcriptional regulator|uniref:TetR/AcrR family transcriptional regulator n=1 Tax=Streptomyces sp. FXJ1.172 TaxID=710705 RepID=UPI0007CF3CC9|nr:TetR/AcrR family transcriptional regulator [Streptomyces sp. FXJ1.172]WEO96540.1 TetR/AcrR family transcriptional regulator [Streptomyces sp. FXJ1.172]